MMKPWRYPATANAAASAIKTRSSRSPDTASTVSGLRGGRNACGLIDQAYRAWVPNAVHYQPGLRTDAWPARSSAKSVHRVLQAGQSRAWWELSHIRRIPRLLPAAEREQAVDHERGEAPDQHLACLEGRPCLAGRIPDHQPASRVGQVGDGDPSDGCHLGGIARGYPHRLAPPREHRRDAVAGPRDVQVGQDGDYVDPCRVDERLLG